VVIMLIVVRGYIVLGRNKKQTSFEVIENSRRDKNETSVMPDEAVVCRMTDWGEIGREGRKYGPLL
jgi:hypothetical protein